MEQTYITLNNGCKIPQFGLGVFQIPKDEDAEKACLEAFRLGYRHIDTAHHYHNERGVGMAIKESGLKRSEVWITSKLWPNEYGEDITGEAVDKMLARLDTEYIDLLLLHQQVGNYIGGWKGLEKAVRDKKVRSIGLSNFESERLEEVLSTAEIMPAVLQIECHPYYQQGAIKKRIEPYKIKTECWFPIGHGDPALINEPVFTRLAEKYGKTNVQIILRWHIQEGNIIIPRSTNPIHLKENIDIFDFNLTDEEIKEIRELDHGVRYYKRTLQEQEKMYLDIILDD